MCRKLMIMAGSFIKKSSSNLRIIGILPIVKWININSNNWIKWHMHPMQVLLGKSIGLRYRAIHVHNTDWYLIITVPYCMLCMCNTVTVCHHNFTVHRPATFWTTCNSIVTWSSLSIIPPSLQWWVNVWNGVQHLSNYFCQNDGSGFICCTCWSLPVQQ